MSPRDAGTATVADKAATEEDRIRRWEAENAEAIAAMNDYVEKRGIPLARHRVSAPSKA